MKIRNLNKYITANIMSLMGYAGLGFLLFYFWVIKPEGIAYNIANNIPAKDDFGSSVVFAGFWGMYTLILLIAVIMLFVEYFLRKKYELNLFKKITIHEYLRVIYTILFWIGIILSLMPLYLFIYILFVFVISSF